MQYTVYLILAPIAGVIAVFSTLVSWRERKVTGYRSLPWILVCICGFLFCNFLELVAGTKAGTMFWARMEYIFLPLMPFLWMRFALEYSRRLVAMDTRVFIWLYLIPGLTSLSAWIPPLNGLLWAQYSIEQVGAGIMVLNVVQHGPLFWVFVLQSYLSSLIGSVLMIGYSLTSNALYRRQSFWVVIGALLPLVGNFIYISRIIPGLTKDFSPIGYSLAGIFFTIGITRYQLLKLMPIARDTLVEQMRDGVIVLDPSDCIVDLNPAARAILDLPMDFWAGRSFPECLADWSPGLPGEPPPPVPRQTTLELNRDNHGQQQFIHLSITRLVDPRGQVYGKLVTLSDISERIHTLQELQRSTDELETRVALRTAELAALNASLEERVSARTRELSILYDVTRAASQAANLTGLLDHTLQCALEALNCRVGAVYLADPGEVSGTPAGFTLAAQHGMQDEDQACLRRLPLQSKWICQALAQRSPLVIPNPETSPFSSQAPFPKTLILACLRTENQVLGMFILAAAQDGQAVELPLFESIANQLSLALRSQQLRQQAILYEERQRLSRDLHDTVTQSLYGLVALTEASQAMLETGRSERISHTLERINQTARQSIKEMRLYIYQLRPPVLEKEGLFGAIQLRLTAVEGRSNIHAHFTVEESLEFTAEAASSLYQIIQEALNNVLRHTLATEVTVLLKRQAGCVLLEIADNGCGFEHARLGGRGMGLANMTARAENLGGVFEVWSQPGEGTRVQVRLPEACLANPYPQPRNGLLVLD